jgi:DNA-binding transcriptional MerR regulator
MLSPQKNRSGQRSYRRRDVEISLRIKELLYDELFTIAGAKKKLQTELRDSSRLKVVYPEPKQESEQLHAVDAPSLFDDELELEEPRQAPRPILNADILSKDGREALRSLGTQLLELREMLRSGTKQ